MSGATRIGLALAAAGSGVATTTAMAMSATPGIQVVDIVLALLVGWSFAGAGLVAWARRRGNWTGPLMVAVGFSWFVAHCEGAPWPLVSTVAELVGPLYLALVGHTLLGFPTGRLRTFPARMIVVGAYLDTVAVELVMLALASAPQVIVDGQLSIGVVLAVALVAVLMSRWARATRAARRAVAPVFWSGGIAISLLVVVLLDNRLRLGYGQIDDRLFEAALACVPLGFLAGLLRTHLARASVAELVVQLGAGVPPGALRDALARSLGDPTLTLAYWVPERRQHVDLEGRVVALPTDGSRVATAVERDGRRIAALVHDAALTEDSGLVEAVGAAAALALDNERLQAELRARLAELAESRARLVEAADAERRRLERNLHDGVQQRLVSISMALGLAASKVAEDPAAAGELLGEARDSLASALADLRAVSQGIHPAALTERGLALALTELAWIATVPVELSVDLPERLPEAVEATAYYVVAEALANVTKHAQATVVRVTVERVADQLLVLIADDGVGGADPTRGSGLAGLDDRVSALGGTLELVSAIRGGTSLRVRLPCA
jgi:signal transduction histidine kinase